MQKTTKIIIGVIVLLLIGAVIWGVFSSKIDLGIKQKGEAIAVVNREKIYKSEFDEGKASLIAQQGIDLTSMDATSTKQLDQQIIDNLVTLKLLTQSVKNKNIKISDDEVNSKISEIKSQFPSDEEFQKTMNDNSMTEEKLFEEIKTDLGIQKLFENELSLSSIKVTDDEINSFYKEVSATQEEIPPLEESRSQIEQILIQQKQQQLISELILKLKSESKIEILN